ncbi:hypothetical protein [Geomicrobium sp. JCM 19039]|uniref:hypothetical protein n=1 Tax=Geomicrobium sp. JCM 19039 TaxID=1460636 RepID=UPI0005A8CDFF|nr:hypothetical protein [Geomicrobium sp. JCM 19039]
MSAKIVKLGKLARKNCKLARKVAPRYDSNPTAQIRETLRSFYIDMGFSKKWVLIKETPIKDSVDAGSAIYSKRNNRIRFSNFLF